MSLTRLSAQSSDTTRLVPVPKWKIDRLLQAYFYSLPTCDSTVNIQNKAIDTLNFALERGKEVIEVLTLERDNKAKEAEILRARAENEEVIHKQELKAVKRKGFKTGLAFGGGLGIILLLLL